MPTRARALSTRASTTFSVALWVLGAFAATQIFAVLWSLVSGRSHSVEVTAAPTGSPPAALMVDTSAESTVGPPPAAQVPGPLIPELPISSPTAMGATVPPATGVPLGAAASESSPLSLPSQPTGPTLFLPASQRITDIVALEAIAEGAELRSEGDTRGALARLREAELLLPNHPIVIYELARTYKAMGLKDKAMDQFEEIYVLGEEIAGDYYALADIELRGGMPDAAGAAAELATGTLLRLGEVAIDRGAPLADGSQRVALRIPVQQASVGEVYNPALSVYVFFFDRVNGQTIEQTTADPPTYSWRSLPVDWAAGEPEILEVVYYLPPLTDEEIRDIGRREFYGFIVKLYYHDELQDLLANPRTLVDRSHSAQPPRTDASLFPQK